MGISRDAYLEVLNRKNRPLFTPRIIKISWETELQKWLALWLFGLNVLYCANPHAGMKMTLKQGSRAKAMGYRRGFPDMAIYEPRGKYHAMFIELKFNNSNVSDFQKAWKEALTQRGYYAVIVPGNLSYLDAQAWIKREVEEYLNSTYINIA